MLIKNFEHIWSLLDGWQLDSITKCEKVIACTHSRTILIVSRLWSSDERRQKCFHFEVCMFVPRRKSNNPIVSQSLSEYGATKKSFFSAPIMGLFALLMDGRIISMNTRFIIAESQSLTRYSPRKRVTLKRANQRQMNISRRFAHFSMTC